MAKATKSTKSGSFMESLKGGNEEKVMNPTGTVTDILDQLENFSVAEQNEIVSEVLKRVKHNRQRSFEENQSKLAGLQQDLASFDEAISAGLNAPNEQPDPVTA